MAEVIYDFSGKIVANLTTKERDIIFALDDRPALRPTISYQNEIWGFLVTSESEAERLINFLSIAKFKVYTYFLNQNS